MYSYKILAIFPMYVVQYTLVAYFISNSLVLFNLLPWIFLYWQPLVGSLYL